MKTRLSNNKLTIFLEGRIDTNNAAAVEAELMSAVRSAQGAEIVLDAEGLSYISSAGLRVLMKLRKQAGTAITVENVSREVYDIFETTGFTELLNVKKALRQLSVEGCELIGSGGFGRVYRIDPETIVKVYNPGLTLDLVQQERDTAQKAFLMGVPTAISYDVVKCGDCFGVVYELLNAKTVAQIMDADRSRVAEMGQKSARLLRSLHEISVEDGVLPDRKAEMIQWVDKIAPILEPSEAEELRGFLRAVPGCRTFLHGDFNSKNIMVQEDGEFVLIDLGDAAFGHPVFDVAGLTLPYLFLLKSPMPGAEIRRLLGFDPEDGALMWGTMCGTYFESAEIASWTQTIMPYGQLLATYQGTRLAGYDMDYMKQRSLPGIRNRLLPLIRSAKPLNW